MSVWDQLLRYLISLDVTSQDPRRTDFPVLLPTRLYAHNQRCALPTLLRHSILKRPAGSIEISINCPSPTPFGLSLGPGLPWEDEPSPGNLRFSAGEILTPLIAYLYRHSHFHALQCSLQNTFSAHGTLPYPRSEDHAIVSVTDLSPVEFSAQGHSTSELLRTL